MSSRDLVSIDLGSDSIKIAIGYEDKKYLRVKNILSFNTPVNSIVNGDIVDEKSLVAAFEPIVSMFKLSGMKAALTIQGSNYIMRDFVLPIVKQNEVNSMLQYEIENYLPVNISESVIDYKQDNYYKDDDTGGKMRLQAVIASKKNVDTYYKFLKDLKLEPEIMDINFNSLEKLYMKCMRFGDNKGNLDVVFIDFGHESIHVNLFSGSGSGRFNRTLQHGGKDLNLAIAQHFDIDYFEAKLKKHSTLDLMSGFMPRSDEHIVNELVKEEINEWLRQIVKIFDFHISRGVKNKIDLIVAYGGTVNIKGFTDYLNKQLQLPVYDITGMNNFKSKKQSEIYKHGIYYNAIGTMIRK